MRALFLTADLGGNVPPTLAVARALRQRGIEVSVAGLAPGRCEFPGPDFPASIAASSQFGAPGLLRSAAMLRLLASRGSAGAAARLVGEEDPDVVIVDGLTLAPLRGALGCGPPVVALFHTLGGFWDRQLDRSALGHCLGAVGMRPRRLWASAAARLLLTDPELDPGRSDYGLTEFTWTGTTEAGVDPAPRGARPRVLVSLGTTDWPGLLPVYLRIVEALSRLPVDAIVTTGGVNLGGDLPETETVRVQRFVDHAAILPTVDLVIGHGGHSTTLRALAHGIPLLLLPINAISDQRHVAKVVCSAGMGRVLPRRTSALRIRETIAQMLEDQGLRETAQMTGRRLRDRRPGAETAADRILAVASRPGPS